MAQSSTNPSHSMTLGLDLDGVITENPEFFSMWTHSWPGKIIVVTYRKDRQRAIDDLESRNIKYDEVILVDRFEAKAEVIKERQIAIYIDDQPEMLKNVASETIVMLYRNEGNFDFNDRRWMLSNQTGKIIV